MIPCREFLKDGEPKGSFLFSGEQIPDLVEAYWNDPDSDLSQMDLKETLDWFLGQIADLQHRVMKAKERARKAEAERDSSRELLRKAEERLAAAAAQRPVDVRSFLQVPRGPPNHPKLRKGDGQGDPPAEGSFLYARIEDQFCELTVKVMLIRAQEAVRKEEWGKVFDLAVQARERAKQLDFEPLVGKCYFWQGVAEYRQAMYSDALNSLQRAEACRAFYQEGRWIKTWSTATRQKLNMPVV